MRRSQWSLQDAKNRFSAVVKAAQTSPQTITKHGKPDAVVLGIEQFERLKILEKLHAPSFKELLLAIPKGGEPFERMEIKPRDIEF